MPPVAAAQDVLPPGTLGPPTERAPQRDGSLALPADTVVVSADSHISLAEDIWHDRFPASMKDRAPRIWYEDAGYFQFGTREKPLLPSQVTLALDQYEGLPGCHSNRMAERMADLDAECIDKELVFPNGIQTMFGYPDLEVRDLCFRIFNEYLAELQEKAPGRFYGVGLVNWWDPRGTRRALEELKALGLRTFLLPMKTRPISGAEGIDWTSDAMTPVWEEIEASGIPVSHHIGEAPQMTQYNFLPMSFVFNAGTFREMFGKYVFGGILDRHPGLQVGWYEGGINWVLSTLQDAELAHASFRHTYNWELRNEIAWYWRNHMRASFIVDPLGLELVDRIGVDRVMWSSDYPHTESSYGYGRNSLQQVFDITGPEKGRAIVGTNAIDFLKL